jgi:acetylornithine deacetylase/succinyl-diaminopimelate desuccinylase-like protein
VFYVKDYYHIDEIIELTECLISIPSHQHVQGKEKMIAEFIYDFCGSNGLKVNYQMVQGQRKNVLAVLPEADAEIR